MRKLSAVFIVMIITSLFCSAQSPFEGKWNLVKAKSSDYDYFQNVTIEFNFNKDDLQIHRWQGPKRKFEEKLSLKTDGKFREFEIKDGTFATNLYMGLRLPKGEKKSVAAILKGNELKITEKYKLLSSQGLKIAETQYLYKISEDNELMTCDIIRDFRKNGPPMKLTFKKADVKNAYVMKMSDDWDIFSKLPEHACLISIQGLVNEKKPNLYFTFGPEYPFNYTEDLYNYLVDRKNFTFTKLNTLEQAIRIFKDYIKGYIIWDEEARSSLIVAYTLAGLEKGIVVTADMIPVMKKYGLKEIDDFRGRFVGKSDFEIYSWAKEKYWSRCSRDVIVWLGGIHGTTLQPAAADYGMVKKGFFSDLSGRQSDTLEYKLTCDLLSQIKPLGQVWGWHSYKKDREEEMITLSSSFGLLQEGLNSSPNTTFLMHIPASPGFKPKNNHNVVPGKKYIPENKVYIAFIETDGMGLGAWVKPGRGSIPYAWEYPMKYIHTAPVMLEYYYEQATPNDFFIGALSGTGYMYPRAFPKHLLPKEIEASYKLMKENDLNVFEIMDYAGDKNEAGDNNLPKDIVDEYYKGMPDAIGFINGYFAGNTFTVRDKRPMISYDYYLSPEKPADEAAGDLMELAEINSKRPYFLLVHVREFSDIARVKSICDKLGSGFEVVPLDIFLKMAGENPTFKEEYYSPER